MRYTYMYTCRAPLVPSTDDHGFWGGHRRTIRHKDYGIYVNTTYRYVWE